MDQLIFTEIKKVFLSEKVTKDADTVPKWKKASLQHIVQQHGGSYVVNLYISEYDNSTTDGLIKPAAALMRRRGADQCSLWCYKEGCIETGSSTEIKGPS